MVGLEEEKVYRAFCLFVEMTPVAKGRPRFTRSGRTYTPKKTVDSEKKIRDAFNKAFPEWKPLRGPLSVNMTFYFKRPKCRIKFDETYHIIKPDADNLAKEQDALNKIAWLDDSQIAVLHVEKLYSDSVEGVKIECKQI